MTDSKISSLPNMQQIDQEASEWIMRFDGGDVSPETRAAFEDWRGQSPQHRAAAERALAFWNGMGVIEDFADHAEAEALVEPLRLDAATRKKLPRRQVMYGSVAACMVLLAGIGATQIIANSRYSFANSYVTHLGEQKTVALPDGSSVVLNSDGALEVEFSPKERIVRLLKGEAYFEVEHNPNSPFSVRTANGVVTAVGTAFSVSLQNGKMDVMVTEGRVALSAGDPVNSEDQNRKTDDARGMEVSAGQSAVYNQKVEALDFLSPEAVEKKLDWQDGLLAFHGEPLREVVAEVSRYTDIKIEIAGDELAGRRVAALYRVGSIEPMLEALKLTAGVEVERFDERHIILRQSQ